MMGLYQRWLTRFRYAAPQTHTKICLSIGAFTLFVIVITYIQLTAIPKLPVKVIEEHHEGELIMPNIGKLVLKG